MFEDGTATKCLPHNSTASIKPYTLSMRYGMLLVTSCETRQLLLYDTLDRMKSVNSIQLPRDILPRHAVETDRNTIIFCHTGPQKRVGIHR